MKHKAIAATLAATAATAATAGAAGAVIAASAIPASAAVPAAAGLRCHASMSNSHPADYTSIYVNVGTVRYASVTTVAHYRTVSRKHTGKANSKGNAKIDYYISGATPGYQVKVSVIVTSGRDRGSCSTSFTPHR